MNTLLLAVIVIVGIALFVALAKSKGGPSEFPYQLSKYLLSKAERSFYGVLVQALGNTGLVFSKVRVADVITPQKGLNRSDWQRAFNAVSSKHFDFLVCDPTDCSIKLAIELDDASHSTAKSQKRDSLLNGACKSAGLPLLRIKAAKGYVVAEIQRQIEEALSPSQEVQVPSAVVQALVSEPMVSEVIPADEPTPKLSLIQDSGPVEKPIPAVAREDEPTSPNCPKCGEPMLRRKAKSGSNAGQEFWGCSAFPKCRAVVKIDA
jgi:very-short-patch-repair endonuclease